MQKVQALVIAETVVLVVLSAWWWQRDDIAPPVAPAPADAPTNATSPAAANRDPSPAVAKEHAAQRSAAPVGSGAIASTVILQGRLCGIEPPPKAEIVRLSCRRDGEWRPTSINDEGVYAITGLQPGRWQLSCEVDGCRRLELEHEVTSTPIQRLDLTLERATLLKVFVRTSTGARLQAELVKIGVWQGLQVVATTAPLAGDLAPTESSSVMGVGIGRHRRSGDMNQRADENGDDGILELDQPPPAHAALLLRHVVLAQQRIDPGQQELRFTVDLEAVRARFATVRLRLLDELGRPVAKARLDLSSAQGGGAHAITADDGTALLKDVVPGLSQFSVMAGHSEDYTTHFVVAPGARLDLGDIVLHPATNVSGTVVDAEGKPSSASVQWTNLDLWQPPNPFSDQRSTSTDGDGNFQVRIGPHRYIVRATTEAGLVGHALLDARGTNGPPFRITLRPGTPVRFVARGPAITTYVLVVRHADGHPIDVRRIEPRWREAVITVPAGDYTLDLYDGDGTLLRREPLLVGTAKLRKEVP